MQKLWATLPDTLPNLPCPTEPRSLGSCEGSHSAEIQHLWAKHAYSNLSPEMKILLKPVPSMFCFILDNEVIWNLKWSNRWERSQWHWKYLRNTTCSDDTNKVRSLACRYLKPLGLALRVRQWWIHLGTREANKVLAVSESSSCLFSTEFRSSCLTLRATQVFCECSVFLIT